MEPTTLDPQVLAAAQQIVMANWATQQGAQAGYKEVSSTPATGRFAHGNGGLLSAPGLSRDIINAMMLPHLGLQRLVPSRASVEDFPLYAILTGQTASTGTFNGTNAAGVCGDPPTAGLLKLCEQSYRFGRQSMMTPVIELDRVGRLTNRGEFTDHRLIGNPFEGSFGVAPTVPGDRGIQAALAGEVGKTMFELAVAWVRDFAPFFYTGNRTNNTGGGIIAEYNGLDGLINTGYRDAETGVACARADSLVRSFNSANLATGAGGSNGIVRAITGIMRQLWFRATEMGLTPVRWVLAMRWSAFYELTEVWPCAYQTYRCTTDSAQPVNNDAQFLMNMRDGMRGNWDDRTGQYLIIDGRKVEVVIDDAIPETALANGSFNSSIYFVPLTVVGGFQSLFMEYFPYDTPEGAMAAARVLAPGDSYFTTDGGRFLWHKRPPTAYCVQAQVKTEPRLILRTPQIAARLTNVAYTPWQHEDDAFTTGYYFLNGGKTNRDGYGPSFWSVNTNIG